jgi:hypothetical protein
MDQRRAGPEKAAQQGGVVVRDAVGNVLAMATR